MKLVFIILAILIPRICFAAVALDVCSTSNGVSITSLTWSHTVTGANPLLVATFHGAGGSGGEVSGITYNAVGLTLKSIFYGVHDPGPGLEVYYNTAVATGAHNVVISNLDLSDYAGSACSFTGVDQSTPLGTAVTNEADPLDSGSITVPTNGMAYEVAIWGRGATACTTSNATAGGQTKEFQDCANNGAGNSQTGFGSTRTATGNFTYDASDSAYPASIAMPISPVPSVTARPRRGPVEFR